MNNKPNCYQMSDVEMRSFLVYIMLLERNGVKFNAAHP